MQINGYLEQVNIVPDNLQTRYDRVSCPDCGSKHVRRTQRKWLERSLSILLPFKAYHCGQCKTRFIRRAAVCS